jgi:AraC-like DNA-binding protein
MKRFLLCLSAFLLLFLSTIKGIDVDALIHQCGKLGEELNYKELSACSMELLNAAKKSGDKRAESYANYYFGTSKLMIGQNKQSKAYLERANNIALTTDDDSLKALTYNTLGIYEATVTLNMYIAQQYFLKSLRIANKCGYIEMSASVYGNLSELAADQQDVTGLKYAIACYNLAQKCNLPHHEFFGAFCISKLYHIKGDNIRAKEYFVKAMNLANKYKVKDLYQLYTLYASILNSDKEYYEAEKYGMLAIDNAKQNGVKELSGPYYQIALAYNRLGNYQQSSNYCKLALAASNSGAEHTYDVKIYELLSKNSEMQGDFRTSLEYQRKAKQMADSANNVDIQHLVQERQMVYEIEKKEHEIVMHKQQLVNQRIVISILAICVVLLIAFLIVVIYHLIHRNRLYKSIVRQNTMSIKREEEMKEHIEKMLEAKDSEVKKIDQDKAQNIFDRLCDMMEKDALYTDSQLNRDRLAQLLNTNHTYLTQIIKEKTGMNLAQLINSYRIKEAVKVLSDKNKIDYPLKSLCADLGFSSLSRFYALFKESVGISPSAYRKSLIDISKGDEENE